MIHLPRPATLPPRSTTQPAGGVVAASAPTGTSDDVLLAALQAHGGDVRATAASLAMNPARVLSRVEKGGAHFDTVRGAVDAWVTRSTASTHAWSAMQPDPREVRGEAQRAAERAERRALDAKSPAETAQHLAEAVGHWLEAAALEPAHESQRSGGTLDLSLRALDTLCALQAGDSEGPWQAIRAALAGDLAACARLSATLDAPPGGVSPAEALQGALAARSLDALARKAAGLTPDAAGAAQRALASEVRDAMEAHPQQASDFLAVAVEAYGRSGRLAPGARHVRQELRAFGELCDRAVALAGPAARCPVALLEADAWRLAGHAPRARAHLAEARAHAVSPEQRRGVAIAQLRLESELGTPGRALAALPELAALAQSPEERALVSLLAGQLWAERARGEQSARGPAGGAALEEARRALFVGRQHLQESARGTGVLPPSARRIAGLLDAARSDLRGPGAAGGPGRAKSPAGGGAERARLLRMLECAPLLAGSGLAPGRALDPAWLPAPGHASGQVGAFVALAQAGLEGVTPQLASSARDAAPAAARAAFLDILRGRQGQPRAVADARRDRALGLRVARALLPAAEAAPVATLAPEQAARLREAFPSVAQGLGVLTPTEGPATPQEWHTRLQELGFAPQGEERYRYVGSDPRLEGALIERSPRRFAGVGDEAECCELRFGALGSDTAGEPRFVALDTQVHIGSLVFSAERWHRVEQGYQDTLDRAARALRSASGSRLQPGDLAEVRTLISLGRDDQVSGGSRLDRVRDRMELLRLSRRITDKAAELRKAGVLEGFQLEIGEENAAGKTTIGQMALDAVVAAGFAGRSYSPKAPTDAEKQQHPIQRHIDHGPSAGEAVFSDRTMAGSYAYNPKAGEEYLADMAARRRAWDEALFDQGIAQVSLQVNPGRSLAGEAHEDYAAQTSYVMGKREARARVAQHLLTRYEAEGTLTPEQRAGLQAAAAAGPGYRDLESLHTGEEAALRAETFARRVSNPHNEWAFIGSLERHPSRVEILQTVLDKLDDFAARSRAQAHALAPLFAAGDAQPMPEDAAARDVWRRALDLVRRPGGASDALRTQCNGVAARIDAAGEVELVLRQALPAGHPERLPRGELIDQMRRALAAQGAAAPRVRIRIFDPALAAGGAEG